MAIEMRRSIDDTTVAKTKATNDDKYNTVATQQTFCDSVSTPWMSEILLSKIYVTIIPYPTFTTSSCRRGIVFALLRLEPRDAD
jgi:hypothetical protein